MDNLNTAINYGHILRKTAKELLRQVDPRTVRMRDPGRNLKRTVITIFILMSLVVGAAAFGSTGDDDTKQPKVVTATSHAFKQQNSSTGTTTQVVAPRVRSDETQKIPSKKQPNIDSKPANFYDPLYVFTNTPITTITAYPMADPPGIVVNIHGIPEPEESAVEMVGKDTRIKRIRRRVTSGTVRYILSLTTPIKRIEVDHEGNVIVIAPVK